jgi:hypothetical protein
MGARIGFADVLCSKLAEALPHVVLCRPSAPRIASPAWVHRLEPLRVLPAPFVHLRYPHPASAAPAAGGIPVAESRRTTRGGSAARSRRSHREQVAISLLNRLGASLTDAATDGDVRSAYRRLVRATHPDLHQDGDAASRDRRARTLRAAIRAWDIFQGRSPAAS